MLTIFARRGASNLTGVPWNTAGSAVGAAFAVGRWQRVPTSHFSQSRCFCRVTTFSSRTAHPHIVIHKHINHIINHTLQFCKGRLSRIVQFGQCSLFIYVHSSTYMCFKTHRCAFEVHFQIRAVHH